MKKEYIRRKKADFIDFGLSVVLSPKRCFAGSTVVMGEGEVVEHLWFRCGLVRPLKRLYIQCQFRSHFPAGTSVEIGPEVN